MTMHTAEIRPEDGIVDLFAVAVPPVPTGSVCYAQNISNVECDIGDNITLTGGHLVMGTKINQNGTSIMDFAATDTPFARSNLSKCTITIHIG